jgi:hypothetical protein
MTASASVALRLVLVRFGGETKGDPLPISQGQDVQRAQVPLESLEICTSI